MSSVSLAIISNYMHILIYSQCLLQKLAFTYNKLLTKVLTDLDVHGININTSQTTE